MKKIILVILFCLFAVATVIGQDKNNLTLPSNQTQTTDTKPIGKGLAVLGAGIIIFGAAMGIGKIGLAACEGSARQPAISRDIRTTMIISCALIEGATFFGLAAAIIVATS